jgi:hypothetical protein
MHMIQAVEYLLSKWEAMSSNPSASKTKTLKAVILFQGGGLSLVE